MPKRVLLTGATGYVGGRLRPLLERAGYEVYCLTRRPNALHAGARTHILSGNLLDRASLPEAVPAFDAAFYLVHCMGDRGQFAEKERRAARNMADWAAAVGVGRIIYLGGLGDSSGALSRHLQSRQDTGVLLRESGIPVIEFRASIILGSGSLSFELIRTLVERLPVMLCPRWVRVKAQPIAIEDTLAYLEAAIAHPLNGSVIYEIGGPEQVSYGDLMQAYADERGLKRLMLPVPLLTPFLSSLWLGLVTPVFARIGRKLIEGVRYPTVVRDDAALHDFSIHPRGVRASIRRALVNEDNAFAQTRWSDALSSAGERRGSGSIRFGARRLDARACTVAVPPEVVFGVVESIGGETGWYYADWLWHVRGFLDLLAGGVGIRRGRRHATTLRVGDALDFWRVEAVEPGRRLRLSAEMRVPGRAWLQFEVVPCAEGSRLHQTAIFDPVGVMGRLYWYMLYPVHAIVFRGMLKAIAGAALNAHANRRDDGHVDV